MNESEREQERRVSAAVVSNPLDMYIWGSSLSSSTCDEMLGVVEGAVDTV
jgi:hypothetical protein